MIKIADRPVVEYSDDSRRKDKCILLLDDTKEIVTLLSRLAEQEGFSTVAATSNSEAFSIVDDPLVFSRISMAFLDIEVGAEYGLEVYRVIRERNKHFPVVIMSGGMFRELLSPILETDSRVAFIQKPFSLHSVRMFMHDSVSDKEGQNDRYQMQYDDESMIG